MSRPNKIATLRSLGYTEPEAQFLYLVATHSGYFTLRHFINFKDQPKGWYVTEFPKKIRRLRHARPVLYGRNTYIFNLYSRRLYAAIDKENLRNRRRLSNELIRARLYILDFVLANPDHQYLETEGEKVRYFHEALGLPLRLLPGRIYKGLRSASNTTRYFVDRFPIFIPKAGNSLSLPPVATFVYCDSGESTLAAYVSHIRAYEKLLSRLPAFNLVYAAPSPARFARAAGFFSRVFIEKGAVDVKALVRYYEVREMWEGGKTSSLTRADRDLLRDGDRRYCGEPFESIFDMWITWSLTDAQVEAELVEHFDCPEAFLAGVFTPMFCPRSTTFSGPKVRPVSEPEIDKVCSACRSVMRSVGQARKTRGQAELCKSRGVETDAARHVPWPGATPFFGTFRAPNPLRAFGGRSRPRDTKDAAQSAAVPRR